jgi:hypothetical protein
MTARAKLQLLLTAMDEIQIEDDARRGGNYDQPLAPTTWFVVDTSKAEPEVNYPGDLISEHSTHEDARLARAEAILDRIEAGAES